MFDKVYRWIVFGVAVSLIPYLLTLLFNWIVGYDFNPSESMPDVLLITFAIGCNALSNEIYAFEGFPNILRKIFITLTSGSLIFCLGLYFTLFNNYGFLSESTRNKLNLEMNRVYFIFYVTIAIIIINTLLGLVIIVLEKIIKNKK